MLPSTDVERALRLQGFALVAGVDEAGRGALAGPVVAAAAVMPANTVIGRVRDSKLIREDEREKLYEQIIRQAICWGVGIVDNLEIDRINILQATFRAMRAAVAQLVVSPDFALIDGNNTANLPIPVRAIVRGDALCYGIAAASIIAKVTRDRIMRQEHELLPCYGFHRHKGYGTLAHRTAILEHGASAIHRWTFLTRLTAVKDEERKGKGDWISA